MAVIGRLPMADRVQPPPATMHQVTAEVDAAMAAEDALRAAAGTLEAEVEDTRVAEVIPAVAGVTPAAAIAERQI